MKSQLTITLLLLTFQSLIYSQITYDKILYQWAETTNIIKTTDNDYFISGSILIPGAYDDIFLTQINPENGECGEINNIGTNQPDINSTVTLANSGIEFVYTAYNFFDDVILFGIINSNGEVTTSFEYPTQELGSTVKAIHSNTNEFIILTAKGYNNPNSNIYLNKFGTTGDLIWSIELGDASTYISGADVLRTPNNSYLVLGSKSDGQSGNKLTIIYEINDSGEVVWESEYITGLDSRAQKIKQKEDNIYSILINESPTGDISMDDYIKVLNINPSGGIIDSVIAADDLTGIHAYDFTLSDNSYVFAGRTFPAEVGTFDNFIIKISNQGEHIWSESHPIPPPTPTSSTSSNFRTIIEHEGGYLIGGDWFDASNGFATLYRVNGSGIITPINNFENNIKVSTFPNPTNDLLHFRSQGNYKYNVRLYNLNGQLINTTYGLEGDHNLSLKNITKESSIVLQIEINEQLIESKIIILE